MWAVAFREGSQMTFEASLFEQWSSRSEDKNNRARLILLNCINLQLKSWWSETDRLKLTCIHKPQHSYNSNWFPAMPPWTLEIRGGGVWLTSWIKCFFLVNSFRKLLFKTSPTFMTSCNQHWRRSSKILDKNSGGGGVEGGHSGTSRSLSDIK